MAPRTFQSITKKTSYQMKRRNSTKTTLASSGFSGAMDDTSSHRERADHMWKEQVLSLPVTLRPPPLHCHKPCYDIWNIQVSSSHGPSHFTRPVTPRPPPRAVSHEDLGTPCGRVCGQERRERSPAEKGIARSRRTSWRRHSLLGTETLTLRCQAYLRASMWSVLPPAQWVGSQAWPCRARSPGPFGIQARSL